MTDNNIEPNVPLAHFPKMNHNVDSQNYVSNIRMRTVIYRANYLLLKTLINDNMGVI